jgi:exocyst complex component 3
MISLLEKEARDPVEVLRVKLKDSTETSLLNSQLVRATCLAREYYWITLFTQLQEIKHDYLLKQDSTKGQLDAFVQAHVRQWTYQSHCIYIYETI